MAVTETGHVAARAVDDLYRRHGAEVYRYAFAVLGNRADAEDVTQTVFLNAYRSLEQGVRPRKPVNWLLTIASNAIKQRFRQERTRPSQVVFDDRVSSDPSDDDSDVPTVGELLTALSHIPPNQRQAIVLREFEGRSYKEIAEILNVTTTALETLLFRARRSLAEELEHQLTCTEAQVAVSHAADRRLGRKERRRLRAHLSECPDCARFAQIQKRHRRALRGLALVPIPVSLSLFKGLEGSATAATLPALGAGAAAAGAGAGAGGLAGAGGGVFAGGVALKAAAVVTAASVAGGVGVVGAGEIADKGKTSGPARTQKADGPGERLGQVAPRGGVVPGRGVAIGKRGNLAKPGRRVGQVDGGALGKSRASQSPERSNRRKATPPAKALHPTPRKSEKAQAARGRARAETERSRQPSATATRSQKGLAKQER